MIGAYNVTLNEMNAAERRAWGERVRAALRRYCQGGDRVIILAGQRYREQLEPALREWGCRIEVPMQGLGIGEQLAWLKRRGRK